MPELTEDKAEKEQVLELVDTYLDLLKDNTSALTH